MIAAYGWRTSSTKDLSAAEIRALFDLVRGGRRRRARDQSTGEGDDVVMSLVRTADRGPCSASDEAPTVIEGGRR